MHLSFLRLWLLVFMIGCIPPAVAHGGSPTDLTLSVFAWTIDASVAASIAMLFWLLAARIAGLVGALTAAVLFLAALASAVLVCMLWHLDAWIVTGLFLSCWLYGAGVQQLRLVTRHNWNAWGWRAAYFSTGIAVLVMALLSPVDTLGEELFSMHMVQHELLMLAAAPLLVAGRPLAAFIWAFPPAARKRIGHLIKANAVRMPWAALTRPLSAWSLHALILWTWHFPALFQASLEDDAVHTLQHLSFLLSALLFWSSLIGPHSRLCHGSAVLYVLTTAIHTGILGALLTFSPRAWYPVYAGRAEAWNLTLLEDQQLGGLIMWVPAGFVFVFAGLAFAARAIAPRNDDHRLVAVPAENRP